MTEMDAGRHEQALDLVEHRRVPRVDCVAPVGLARHDDRDRRRYRLHRPDLHRRRVRAQQDAGPQIERIEALARRMIGRDVERVEVIVFGFDLRAEHDGEAAPLEVAAGVLHRTAHRVQRAVSESRRWKREVDRLSEFRIERACAERCDPLRNVRFHLDPSRIDDLPRLRPVGRGQAADRAADGGNLAAAAQKEHAHGFECRSVVRVVEGGCQTLAERRKVAG